MIGDIVGRFVCSVIPPISVDDDDHDSLMTPLRDSPTRFSLFDDGLDG
jgi:hypothetical protein